MAKIFSKIFCGTLVFVLIFLVSCTYETNSEPNNTDEPKATMLSVLNGEASFINEGNNAVTIDAVFEGEKEYAFVDMDNDKCDEMVIRNTETYLVLRYNASEKTVYGYELSPRSLEVIKTDGTSLGSSGAADNSISYLKFDKELTFNELARIDEINQIFTVNGKTVTQQEAEAYFSEWKKKENVDWIK